MYLFQTMLYYLIENLPSAIFGVFNYIKNKEKRWGGVIAVLRRSTVNDNRAILRSLVGKQVVREIVRILRAGMLLM